MGCLYLGHDGVVRVWAGCIYVRMGCENMGWLYLGQVRGMRIWAVCILVRIWE
jgi:hypothetical protein